MSEKQSLPWGFLLYDMLGTVLLALGIAAQAGINFGYSVLTSVAPALIVTGVLLMAPLVVWVVRRARQDR